MYQHAIPLGMAALSALGSGMSAYGKSRAPQTTQIPRFNPGQIEMMNELGQMGMQGLRDPYAGFEPIKQQAQSDFRSSVLPGIAEQFAGIGGTKSSGYQGMMSGAGENLQRQLAAMQSQYGLQNRGQMMNMAQMGLQPQFESFHRPESQGIMQMLGNMLAGQGLGGLGQMMGGKYMADQKAANRSDAIKQWQEFQESQGNQRNTGYSPVDYANGYAYSGGR